MPAIHNRDASAIIILLLHAHKNHILARLLHSLWLDAKNRCLLGDFLAHAQRVRKRASNAWPMQFAAGPHAARERRRRVVRDVCAVRAELILQEGRGEVGEVVAWRQGGVIGERGAGAYWGIGEQGGAIEG